MTKHRYSKSFFIVFCALMTLSAGILITRSNAASQNAPQPKTIILVRHAEKMVVPPENKDPDLSVPGEARAQEIARMFGSSGITTIYATQFKRTQQTVKPLADRLRVPVTVVEAKKDLRPRLSNSRSRRRRDNFHRWSQQYGSGNYRGVGRTKLSYHSGD